MKYLSRIIFMLSLITNLNAVAHTDDYLDSQPSPNGGQVRMAGKYHFELVVSEKQLMVYVTDHAGQSVMIMGATGNAIVLANKTKITVPLKPLRDNVLSGDGQFLSDSEMKVVVSITLQGQESQQARFTPSQKTAHEHH